MRFDSALQRVVRLEQVVQRFERHLAALAQSQGGSLTIELTPRSLGRITVNCDAKGKDLSLELLADTGAARAFLADHAKDIQDIVRNNGYALLQFGVRTRNEGSDPQATTQRQAGGWGRERKAARETAAATGMADPTPAPWSVRHEHAVWLVA
jgi:flagellar hook-length control protein FliK